MEAPSFIERGPILALNPETQKLGHQAVLDRLARMVGVVGFGLPLVLIFGATVGGSDCFRDSISHFYHAQFLGGIFVGLLFFIGGFLIAYTGDTRRENVASTIAGFGAFGVALFPTSGSGCSGLTTPFESRVFAVVTNPTTPGASETVREATDGSQTFFDLFNVSSDAFMLGATDLHMVGAGILFVFLGWYCMFVLRRIIPSIHGEGASLLPSKRRRNTLYFWCAIMIWICVALLALRGRIGIDEAWWNSWNLTFWVELVALWAFAVAWTAKGRVFKKLNDVQHAGT